MKNSILALLLLLLFAPKPVVSQALSSNELPYGVNKIYPYISISKAALNDAHTLSDLNPRYPSSWIREYVSVEVLTSHQGETQKAISKSDSLSWEQKTLLNRADLGTDISVTVQYIPENTLKHNEPKTIDFTFTIDPASDAQYIGGLQQMQQYFREKAIDDIPKDFFENYDLTAVKFTIDEEGQIMNAHIFGEEYQAAKFESINERLLEAVRRMPCWEPAAYADGTKVSQEFVLLVGNRQNCVVNMLNIHRDSLGHSSGNH